MIKVVILSDKIVILSEAKDLRLFTAFKVTENMGLQAFTQSDVPLSLSLIHI